jgi:hypothetical protein
MVENKKIEISKYGHFKFLKRETWDECNVSKDVRFVETVYMDPGLCTKNPAVSNHTSNVTSILCG